MTRTVKLPSLVQLRVPDDLLSRLDDWRRHEDDIPSRSEAIRRLLEQALSASQPAEATASLRTLLEDFYAEDPARIEEQSFAPGTSPTAAAAADLQQHRLAIGLEQLLGRIEEYQGEAAARLSKWLRAAIG